MTREQMEELAKSAAQAAVMSVKQPTETVAVESFLNAYEYATKIIKEKQERKEMDSVMNEAMVEANKLFDTPSTPISNNENLQRKSFSIRDAANLTTLEEFDDFFKENIGLPSYVDPMHPDDPDYDNIFTSPRL